MKAMIGFTREAKDTYVVRVNGFIMACVYKCNHGKDVRIDDFIVHESFITPKTDLETAISFVIMGYASSYETIGADVDIPQAKHV